MASTPDTQQSLLREAHMEMIFSQLLILDQISDSATYDALIPSLLENIGQITHADRAYIFSIHEEEECYYRNAYEWCQDGVTPQIENLQHVPAALIPYWDGTLRRGKAISTWDLETVRDTMPAEYAILHAQDVHSIAVLPIFATGKFIGFIGLDDPDHSIYDIASKMLQVISGHLSCIYSHLEAQKALSENRARLKSQLLSLRRETYLVDVLASDYRCIVRCNLTQDTFETIKGSTRCPTGTSGVFSEWVRRAYDEYIIHASAPDFLSFFDRKQLLAALSTKQILNYRIEVIPDETGHRYLEVQIAPLHSVEDGQHKIALGIRSIDDLVLREKCLQAEKERTRKRLQFRRDLISTIGKIYRAIYFLDLDKGTYMEITGEAEYQKAIGNEGLLNKSTPIFRKSFIAPESQASMKDFLDPSTLSDRLRERDTLYQPYLSADGLWHLGCFIVKRRHEDGSASTLLYTIQNIDEVKRTEIAYQEKLKKSAREAQIANQAKTDFLRRMSHDVRTPINGILGMIEIADNHPTDIEKLQDCRHKIRQAAGTLLSLVSDILDMNKLESGTLEPESVPFDIFALLMESNHLTEMQAPAYGVTVRVKNPPLPGPPRHRLPHLPSPRPPEPFQQCAEVQPPRRTHRFLLRQDRDQGREGLLHADLRRHRHRDESILPEPRLRALHAGVGYGPHPLHGYRPRSFHREGVRLKNGRHDHPLQPEGCRHPLHHHHPLHHRPCIAGSGDSKPEPRLPLRPSCPPRRGQ